MRDKLVQWVKDNRFLLLMTGILLLVAPLTFVLGKAPTENIASAFRGLSSNLTAEIVGALIAIWVINTLLKRQREHSLRDVHNLTADAIRFTIYDTVEKVVGSIANPRYEVVNSSAFNELLDSIVECKPDEAFVQLQSLIGTSLSYPPLEPQAYVEARNAALRQIKEWTDLQIRFQQYLSLSQFTGCARIIDILKDIYSHSAEVERLFRRLDDTNKSMKSSKMVPQLADELRRLAEKSLELLRISLA